MRVPEDHPSPPSAASSDSHHRTYLATVTQCSRFELNWTTQMPLWMNPHPLSPKDNQNGHCSFTNQFSRMSYWQRLVWTEQVVEDSVLLFTVPFPWNSPGACCPSDPDTLFLKSYPLSTSEDTFISEDGLGCRATGNDLLFYENEALVRRDTDLSKGESSRGLVCAPCTCGQALSLTLWDLSSLVWAFLFFFCAVKVRSWIFFVSREAPLFYHKLYFSCVFPFSKFSGRT